MSSTVLHRLQGSFEMPHFFTFLFLSLLITYFGPCLCSSTFWPFSCFKYCFFFPRISSHFFWTFTFLLDITYRKMRETEVCIMTLILKRRCSLIIESEMAHLWAANISKWATKFPVSCVHLWAPLATAYLRAGLNLVLYSSALQSCTSVQNFRRSLISRTWFSHGSEDRVHFN